jgi:lysophospholipase L1-like esterase
MPLGDSITYGVPVAGGYRRLLEERLGEEMSFEFVGGQQDNSPAMSRPNHEGHCGWTIADYIGEGDESVDGEAPIRTFVRNGAPDIVLLLVGTNDLYVGEAEFTRRYRILLSDIYEIRPAAKVVFMEMLPRRDHDDLVAQGHAAAKTVTEEFLASGKQIVLVDPSGSFDPITMSEDGLHPNAQGYEVVARLFDAGLRKLPI